MIFANRPKLEAFNQAMQALIAGDTSIRIPEEGDNLYMELARNYNQLAELGENLFMAVNGAKDQALEGVLSSEVSPEHFEGRWRELAEAINQQTLAYTTPLQIMQRVAQSILEGKLGSKVQPEEFTPKGEVKAILDTHQQTIEFLNIFSNEVTRVAREVGVEGQLGGSAEIPNVAGAWNDLADNVNLMADNLTNQVRNIAEVSTAVANGDFSKKMTAEAKGEIHALGETINTMTETLNTFSEQVILVARTVGVEGKLGIQADVPNVSGVWRELTDNVNLMANNLTEQVRNIAEVATAVANGNLDTSITIEAKGEIADLKETLNQMVRNLLTFNGEVTRVAREVGTEGRLGGQALVPDVSGVWKELTDNVNQMASNLTEQVRNIAEVATAVANGNLDTSITIEAKGEIATLKETLNQMVMNLRTFNSEVTRVAREVGTEGVLGGQAEVPNVSGVWKELTDNVNQMANNLTEQVRNIAEVSTAVANGDFTKKMTAEARGEIRDLGETINNMTGTLSTFSEQVILVARTVGVEGKLGVQADVPDAEGNWRELTDNVNLMAFNLTEQVRNIAEVATNVANGNLDTSITIDASGEIAILKETINQMVLNLRVFNSEVSRVAREVGTEGILGGQAMMPDVSGVWKELTDNVNQMANNLTEQVRNIAEVSTAVANGDFSKKMTAKASGEIQDLGDTINNMTETLSTFSEQVILVARTVGVEGKLGVQASVPNAEGNWRELTDNVNLMASNLTEQVRNIAEVATNVANGNLDTSITIDASGEIANLKETINQMVLNLRTFNSEVTRVAGEVGTEGKLGGQADVPNVSGVWKQLTDNVNTMANNLTNQVRNIAEVASAVANGDFTKQMTADARGEIRDLGETINNMTKTLSIFSEQVILVARTVGVEGQLGVQANVPTAAGNWRELTDNVNMMANNLTEQVRNIAEVATNVANGDLNTSITIDARGEVAQLKETINEMVLNLRTFNSEVTRVAGEVGTEGVLGGQAMVPNVSGVWKELTDNVNTMANNLTNQVRGIVGVITAVADGDLSKKLTIEAKGEIAELSDTINSMTETLNLFSEEVTRVAREVGLEGKLGGQAQVLQAKGIWRELTDNVNQLMNNLTNQVRAIARVALAVTKGDFTQAIDIDVQGEMLDLTGNINQMTLTLKETTEENRQQDWLKTNLAEFFGLMQGQKELKEVAQMLMSKLPPVVNAHHGVFYLMDTGTEQKPIEPTLHLYATYGYKSRKHLSNRFRLGEGLVGQCAFERTPIHLTNVPVDYIKISSGLGEATPLNIIVLPVLFEESVQAVIELASFHSFSSIHITFLEQLSDNIGVVLNVIQASMRTEELLRGSQALTQELQTQQEELKEANTRLENQTTALKESEEKLKAQQEELQQTNEELEDKAQMLSKQKQEVETKNQEVELARGALEEKAEQLALTSKYKSEFLANMSHELRTPLNSMLVLSKLLKEDQGEHLTQKQLEFASTVYESGEDLLGLINDILDLSKVEAGKMDVHPETVEYAEIQRHVEQSFSQIAKDRNVKLNFEIAQKLPSLTTDISRLRQILNNLLANAFKFTEKGSVTLKVFSSQPSNKFDHAYLKEAKSVISFSVADTGIGIPTDKQKLIFEAFQQADGTTNRRYGGTGLGLSISRSVAYLLGGELHLESQIATAKKTGGSTFTLHLPETYRPARKLVESLPPETETSSTQMLDSPIPMSEQRSALEDDLHNIQSGDRVLLIIEDDLNFAKTLLELAHQQHFKAVIALDGESGLSLARQLKPDAITLDIQLPLLNGWALLDLLKHESTTRHIPIHVLSVVEEPKRALEQGAMAYLEKPASKEDLEKTLQQLTEFIDKRVKHLLIVEDDPIQQQHIVELIGNSDVESIVAKDAKAALELLKQQKFDCMILDLILPDMSGIQLLEHIRKQPAHQTLPVVVYTAKEVTDAEEKQLRQLADQIVIKSVKSPERLLAETTLFLHRVESKLPEAKREILQTINVQDEELKGKTILVIDDDSRNLFAITSSLEKYGLQVLTAENGKEGINSLKKHPEIKLVLMDIMMPEMDGYEAMQHIRKVKKYQQLPIIALTAKAMKEDREKCLAAGANDYLTKPIDLERLLSLIRVWLYKK